MLLLFACFSRKLFINYSLNAMNVTSLSLSMLLLLIRVDSSRHNHDDDDFVVDVEVEVEAREYKTNKQTTERTTC